MCAQIVVAGASQTGLACLERLLLQPHTRFTSITLLAPGGIHTDSIAGQLSAAHLARLGLHANVTVVDSHLVALDTQQQLLALADGQQLPYDLLAVTTGVQVCSYVCVGIAHRNFGLAMAAMACRRNSTFCCWSTVTLLHLCGCVVTL